MLLYYYAIICLRYMFMLMYNHAIILVCYYISILLCGSVNFDPGLERHQTHTHTHPGKHKQPDTHTNHACFVLSGVACFVCLVLLVFLSGVAFVFCLVLLLPRIHALY